MPVRCAVIATVALLALALTGCTPTAPPRFLLTTPADEGDPLIGIRIPPAVLGVAATGCLTVGGAILQAPYGSAIADGGAAVALAEIGTVRIGESLPALYGYRVHRTSAQLAPSARRCGPGRYVQAVFSLAPADGLATAVMTGTLRAGGASTADGIVTVAGNGCVRVGGQYLLAPRGSAVVAGGAAVRVGRLGTFRVKRSMPTFAARSTFLTASQVPPALRRCGPGSYLAIDSQQRAPVLVYDDRDGSTRMAVATSVKPGPGSRRISGTLERRNTCVTVGADFLLAPAGSVVAEHGAAVRVVGTGLVRLGGAFPSTPARLITYTAHTLPAGLIDCGPGRYAALSD